MSDNKTIKFRNNTDLSILGNVFRKFPGVQAVYAFGSVAGGSAGPESDLDLAVVPGNRHCRERKLDILHELAKHGFCNVDLVFLDTNDIVLKFEAVRMGLLVYAKDDFHNGSYYSEILRKYFDFSHYLEIQRMSYKERALHGPS